MSWQANEDITYASINHNTAKGSRRTRVISEDDCDYATVNIPETVPTEAVSECSSKEECADDYVLMGWKEQSRRYEMQNKQITSMSPIS